MNLFQMDSIRSERVLRQTGAMAMKASLAFAYAFDRKIVAFPWVHPEILKTISHWLTNQIKLLKEAGALILIPTQYREKFTLL